MKTLTLRINDDYFDKIVSFLEILPKRAVKIEERDKSKKLKKIKEEIFYATNDISQGRTKKVRTIT